MININKVYSYDIVGVPGFDDAMLSNENGVYDTMLQKTLIKIKEIKRETKINNLLNEKSDEQ